MKIFFAPESELPADVGFTLYGGSHICALLLCALLAAALCLRYRGLDSGGRRRLRLAVGWLVLLCEAAKDINLLAQGAFSVYYLPLHLCGLAVFLSFAHALQGGDTLGNLLYGTCMPGALFALLFPDWTAYPVWAYHSAVAFLVHTLLVVYPLMQVLGGDIRPRVRRLPKCFLLLLAMAAPVYAFDRIFGANYMFLLLPAPGSPLEWFAALLGVPGYLLGYIPMLLLVWSALYLPFRKKG